MWGRRWRWSSATASGPTIFLIVTGTRSRRRSAGEAPPKCTTALQTAVVDWGGPSNRKALRVWLPLYVFKSVSSVSTIGDNHVLVT